MTPTKCLLTLIFVSVFSAAGLAAPYMTEPSLSPDRQEIAFVSGGDIWSVPAAGGIARLLVSHPATEMRPLFSPDRKQLAFISTRTGGGDIYILNLDSGNLRRLTFDDTMENLDAWSRDGQWIYFSSSSRDLFGMNDIYRVSANGGTPMTLSADRYTNEFNVTPLADGSFTFAARGFSLSQWWRRGHSHIDESELWKKTGDNYEKLTSIGAKQMWPMSTADGSRLFFVSDRSGAQNIWTKPAGGAEKQLTNFTDGRVLWASMAGDGKEIVFERNFTIWKMKTDGGKAEQVPITLRGVAASPMTERITLSTQLREVALSPDGKKIATIARGEVFAGSSKEGGEATRVTNTPAPESYVTWSPDSKTLVYNSERDGTMAIYQYDFATETETKLTGGGSNSDALPKFSPDGKLLSFIRNSNAMMVYDIATKQERELCKINADTAPLLSGDAYNWSPDSKWVAFLNVTPETRSYTNVYVVPASGGAARPVSFVANANSGSVVWAPDGSYILFDTSQRTEETVIARIDLKLRTPKFREDQFRDLFKQENPKDKQPPVPTTSPSPTPVPSPSASPAVTPVAIFPANTPKKDENKTEIVFDDIRRRLSVLGTGVDSGSPVISPDGKTLLVVASAEGQVNLYTVSLDDLANDSSARQLTSTGGFKSNVQFSPDSKEVYYLENGRVNIVSIDRREVRPLAVSADMNTEFAREKMEVFKQGWRYMRDNFYDDKFHGADWNAVRATYEPYISDARNMDEVRRLMNMMVGELNASHLGVQGAPAFAATPIGKLGLRFDRAEFETNGKLKITEVITLSPAAVVGGISVGDYLVSVDNVNIDGKTNIDELMENKVGKRVVIGISRSGGMSDKRTIVIKPVTTAAEKALLYRQWVESNRAYVAKVSNGKIGYVHLPDMGQGSLNQLYIDLDAENQNKDGVVIDIRNNNGGFINPYVIDILSRKGYLNMTERGRWTVPGRSNLGQRALERPTVLVTNQHSLSDAEDLSEGYRSLKVGKIVGEPTAGWIIFTWNTSLFDGTTFRLPRQRITGNDGKDMELNPRPVDIPVTRPIGETLTGKDSQLDAAVKQLMGGN
jgi:Tol biopolymer transport system component/C-terminal processing protease CtpA/Prc